MAKNKKQDRSRQQQSSTAERGQQQAQQAAMQSEAAHRMEQVTPADIARKGRQKRFGHN
ncbi:hypothetical protein ABZZ79_23975 [Streptomyces sp. NPDC006458]|uniref:hypothetical protein n=1 Tax=Streptomyces sp. NPDC006458 TaxID=3154302 RepID=UPI0033A25B3D